MFGFYHHVRVLEQAGLKIRRVRVANGGAGSKLWRQITTDVVGFPLEGVENRPGPSLGAAFVAGMGMGTFSDWEEIEKYLHIGTNTLPDLEQHDKYKGGPRLERFRPQIPCCLSVAGSMAVMCSQVRLNSQNKSSLYKC